MLQLSVLFYSMRVRLNTVQQMFSLFAWVSKQCFPVSWQHFFFVLELVFEGMHIAQQWFFKPYIITNYMPDNQFTLALAYNNVFSCWVRRGGREG